MVRTDARACARSRSDRPMVDAEILNGLESGETLVLYPSDRIEDGVQVTERGNKAGATESAGVRKANGRPQRQRGWSPNPQGFASATARPQRSEELQENRENGAG
ncbi:MAG: hypothetical protein JKP95_04085 [Oceanicaulis sp.]|nr:hypothetical protein [Oceanicaulis sp.]